MIDTQREGEYFTVVAGITRRIHQHGLVGNSLAYIEGTVNFTIGVHYALNDVVAKRSIIMEHRNTIFHLSSTSFLVCSHSTVSGSRRFHSMLRNIES